MKDKLLKLMRIAQETGEQQSIMLPRPYANLYTFDHPLYNSYQTWTATPNEQGGVDLSYSD